MSIAFFVSSTQTCRRLSKRNHIRKKISSQKQKQLYLYQTKSDQAYRIGHPTLSMVDLLRLLSRLFKG